MPPPQDNQTIGYEMEYSDNRISRSQIVRCLQTAFSAENETFINSLRNESRVNLDDYSGYLLKNEHCGFETTSPVFDGSRKSLIKLRKTLSRINREFKRQGFENPCESSACGLHVHIDRGNLSDTTILNVVRMVYVYEDVLLSLFEREDNNHVDHFRQSFRSLRRVSINGGRGSIRMNDPGGTRTFEFRHAPGMNDTNKTISWIYLIYLMVEIAKSFGNDVPLYRRDVFEHPTREKFARFIMSKSKMIVGKPWLRNVAESSLKKVGFIG